jgi:hypothetical protein
MSSRPATGHTIRCKAGESADVLQTVRVHYRTHGTPCPDPQKATGTEDEKLKNIRSIRDRIKQHIESWIKSL